MASAYKFQFYCGMTCYGGSEQKECPCAGPATCELRNDPGYHQARVDATKRLFNLVCKGAPALSKPEPPAN